MPQSALKAVPRALDTRRTVQELLGHSDIQTTTRYLHSDTRTKQLAVDKLDGLLGTEDAKEDDVSCSHNAMDSSQGIHNTDTAEG